MPNLTLLDWSKRIDPDGSTPIIANLLSQTNAIVQDCVYVRGNLPTGHRVTIATGLPTVYYRALNKGIPTSKAATAQVDEGCAIIEARSEVDIDLASLEDNEAEFRMSEARLFMEAMNQTMATGMFYGNPSDDPKQFLGLSARYGDTTAGNGQNIILSDGAASANTSVWLISWSDQTVFCTYPKGSKVGLVHEDLSRYTQQNAGGISGEMMEVLGDRFQWKTGLVVKDWRYAVRIANINSDSFETLAGELAPADPQNILHLMVMAIARIPNPMMGRMVFYMNRSVYTVLMRTALEKSNSALSVQAATSQFGVPSAMLSFLGVPIRQCDALLNTEGTVS